jgi:hypothetical protein
MPVDRPSRLDACARALGAVVAALSLASCYKPNIKDGGFLCSAKNECPDGFTCASDNRCYRVPPIVTPPVDGGGADLPVEMAPPRPDGGAEGGMCTPPTPLCADEPDAGEACSPACQRGCACGRCNVVDGKPTCVAAGTVKLGELCNPNADNCAPGLICLPETCGNGLARCYRHCTMGATAGAQCEGSACTIRILDGNGNETPYFTCDVPPSACNPVDGSGCPSLSLNCYLNGTQTLCDCPDPTKQGMNNAPCTFYSDCAPGFICISGVDKQTSPHCHFVCDTSHPGYCPQTEPNCVPSATGAQYGYCSM